jgi:hypothetical protein
MEELLKIGIERARVRFPEKDIRPCSTWFENGIFRCTVFVNKELAFGVGKSMNECVDSLLESINCIVERKCDIQLTIENDGQE